MALLALPNELLYEVSNHLPLKDLLNLLKTNTFLSRLLQPATHRFANQERHGLPALCWAGQHGYTPLITILLNKGVDANTQSSPKKPAANTRRQTPKAAKNIHGETALHLAAAGGHEEAVRKLLSHGASGKLQTTNLGETALHKAIKAGSRKEAILRLLVQSGDGIDVQQFDGFSALHLAAARGDRALVQMLVGAGATVDVKSAVTGATPLHEAVCYRHMAVVKLLLKEGAGINIKDITGGTPLMRSAIPNPGRGGWAVLRFLLENGAATNLTNNAGFTALDLAKGIYGRGHGKGATVTIKMKLLCEFEGKRLRGLQSARGG